MKGPTAEQAMIDIDTDIVAGDWDRNIDWEGIAARALAAALAGAGHAGLLEDPGILVEVAVRLSDDAEIRGLNRDWRDRDRPTNILSFPMLDAAGLRQLGRSGSDLLLGDLALAHETVAGEAAARNLSIEAHVAHLLVHGTLHLLGHDHADDASADAMEALETRILAGIGIANPYADIVPTAGECGAETDE